MKGKLDQRGREDKRVRKKIEKEERAESTPINSKHIIDSSKMQCYLYRREDNL